MRNLKILGLALIAVFAMSAVAASMASADSLTSESSPVTVTGLNESGKTDLFTTTAGNTSCTSSDYKGTVKTPATTVTVIPSYSGCTSLGFPAEIHVNGCWYLFHIGAGTTGTVDIGCPVGQEITVTAAAAGTNKCTIHVPEQAGVATATYTNIGSGTTREITVVVKAEGDLKYTHTTGGTGLGKCTGGSGTTGSFEGFGTLTGLNDVGGSGHVALFLS